MSTYLVSPFFKLSDCLHRCKPTLVLGGGGYNEQNTARSWAHLTAECIPFARPSLQSQPVPSHDYFPSYGPSFSMDVRTATVPDENDPKYLDQLLASIFEKMNI
mmetsp:Transcript_24448/g.61006  ORF Transcript_24448/g.61006 Transcript_24448/m.61006 type:complete len:104 (+) Transcript_24448:929-1240(+)